MASREGFVLDGLDLNSPDAGFVLRSLGLSPPTKRPDWITGVDTDGAALLRDPLCDNREISAKVRIGPIADGSTITNLITNPSFEVDLAGWISTVTFYLAGAPTLTRDTTQSVSGIASAKVVTPGAASAEGIGVQSIPVTIGQTYTFSVWLKGNAGGEQGIIRFGGEGGPNFGATAFTLTTAWQRVSVTWTADEATASAVVRRTGTGTAYTFFVDAAQVELASTVTSYFDGYTAGAKWNGTAHASTSTRKFGMDGALAAIGAIVDKLEEAERQPDGLPLIWTPASGSNSVTFYVLSGTVEDIPITRTGDDRGYFLRYPSVAIRMTAKPFGYGAEVTGSTVTSSLPLVTLEQAGVTGDVPAEARLVVTDVATQSRRHVEWGVEQRYYNAATSLIVDSDDMTLHSGAQTTRTGAYDPNASGNNVIRATLGKQISAVCSTGNLSHVGVFRVKARIYALSLDVHVRLSWQEGSGLFHSNPFAAPPVAGNLCEVDLGLIAIPPKVLGTQRWSGRVEAYSDTVEDTIDVDMLELIPAGEGYGKARGAYSYQPGSLVARDEFTGSSGALNGDTAAAGGTWATSGATTDFDAGTAGGSD